MANKKLTPLEILYREFKNAKTDAARNEAWRRFEIKRGEMYPARTDRMSAVMRNPEDIYRMDTNIVTGGLNHRYYDAGTRHRLSKEELAKRSPKVWVDPESGERYVRAFHYTQPENIETILQNGLAARLGPDAKNYQRRTGVWTSFGERNPMPYDFVNNASIGEKGYSMEPLEIRIPEEEWKAMNVDHTGETVNDQVMVFRPSESKPYGIVNINGEKAPVVIPPEFISKYEFPKDYEVNMYGGTKSLWGYRPTKKFINKSDHDFVKSIPENLYNEAVNVLGNDASENQIAQWVIDNRQKEFKDFLTSEKYKRPYGGLLNDDFATIPDEGIDWRKQKDLIQWRNMKNDANRSWFQNTEFENPYDFALATENVPKSSDGAIGNALSGGYIFDSWEKPKRTKEIVTNIAGDKAPVEWFANTNNSTLEIPLKIAEQVSGKTSAWRGADARVKDYLDLAGVRDIGKGRTFSMYENSTRRRFSPEDYLDVNKEREDILKKDIRRWNNDFFKRNYKEDIDRYLSDDAMVRNPQKAKELVNEWGERKISPEVSKQRYEDLKHTLHPHVETPKPIDNASRDSKIRAYMSDKYINKIKSDAEKYIEDGHLVSLPEAERIVSDYDENKAFVQQLVDSYYPEELQKVRRKLVEDWKNQFKQDSLNRVFGHELGRKIGKYRASRGKPVNPKQM